MDITSVLQKITACTDPELVRRWLAAGIREHNKTVEQAARRRLAALAPSAPEAAMPDSLEFAFWSMVDTVEQIRRDEGRKVWRMNRLRPIAEREGVREAIVRCIKEETAGFREVLKYGLPELTAEAIALRHADQFDLETLLKASQRLGTGTDQPGS